VHIGYITQFGWFKKNYNDPEEMRKDFAEYKKALKEHNIDLLFYAGSYGVPEPCMWAAKFKDIKDWEKASRARVGQKNPLEKTRTLYGWDYEE